MTQFSQKQEPQHTLAVQEHRIEESRCNNGSLIENLTCALEKNGATLPEDDATPPLEESPARAPSTVEVGSKYPTKCLDYCHLTYYRRDKQDHQTPIQPLMTRRGKLLSITDFKRFTACDRRQTTSNKDLFTSMTSWSSPFLHPFSWIHAISLSRSSSKESTQIWQILFLLRSLRQ